MQIAHVSTNAPSVRDDIDGWTFEDPALLVRRDHPTNPGKIDIGYTPSPAIQCYTCLLEMLADGWELLGPPQREEWSSDGECHVQWGWWLHRK